MINEMPKLSMIRFKAKTLDVCLTNNITMKSVDECVDSLDIFRTTVVTNNDVDCVLTFVFLACSIFLPHTLNFDNLF